MNVAFRVDASLVIGTGHVMRCLSLAEALVERGHSIIFICRAHPGNLFAEISRRKFLVAVLDSEAGAADNKEEPTERRSWYAKSLGTGWAMDARATAERLREWETVIDWLVVDHYALDERWEASLRSSVERIMVIDDLADRSHECDLLLDQNQCANMEQRYSGLLPSTCRLLIGPDFALLRKEFTDLRAALRGRDGGVQRILVSLGGVDVHNDTRRCIDALLRLDRPEIAVDVVIGATNPHRQEIERVCTINANLHFHCQTPHMANLIAAADIGIGAAGSTCWERCCLGLPTLMISLADNQSPIGIALAAYGAGEFLGRRDEINIELIDNRVSAWLIRPESIRRMSARCLELVAGNGTARVVDAMNA